MIENNAKTSGPRDASRSLRAGLHSLVESGTFQQFIIAAIVVNAVAIGLETSESAMLRFGGLLWSLDVISLAIFVTEISLKLFVYRLRFFRNPWNVFDFAIVAVALVPAGQGFSVLRALRILRALRLLSLIPKMRMVVQGLLAAIPAMGAVLAVLGLVFYVSAVVATKLFGGAFPAWFGTIGASLYSLFQIMTLESWSMGIVRPVMDVVPWAWAFFVPFILVTTFAVLNLFIAIIVNSMHEASAGDKEAEVEATFEFRNEVSALRREIAAWREEARIATDFSREPKP